MSRLVLSAQRVTTTRIVLGEPDDVSRAETERDLRALGLHVETCGTLEEVFGALAGDAVCVLSDELPHGEGVLGVSAVRGGFDSTPLILLVADPEADLVFDAYQNGADMVLNKPVQISDWRAIFGLA